MAIVNRALDASEQKKVIPFALPLLANGATNIMAHIPYPCTLKSIQMAAVGVSTAPTIAVVCNRFIVGTGFTAITLVSAQVYPDFGVSGVLTSGLSLPADGSSLLGLLPNDVIQCVGAVSNSASALLTGGLVVQPIQDIKQFLGGI